MLIRKSLFVIFTFISGSAIACGYVAFITLLGVFDKLSEKYKAMNIRIVTEWLIIAGVSIGNIAFLLNRPFNIAGDSVMTICYMLFNLAGGAFVGCLAGALAETLCIFPILSRRFNIRTMLPYVLMSAAIGKILGAFIELYILK
ncbi:MAG: stage V sporulation protein AB [Lachnospiraceae bacterium]|nr:stage V sporulation protein AB [Lachnospiraceae bacterium]